MNKKIVFLVFLGFGTLISYAQTVQKPKVVIGIVVDQMRADYLDIFEHHYSKNGFQRLKKKGTSFRNCYINFLPSYTGPGHACIYTGSVPAIHGIVGNNWYNSKTGETVYCVADKNEKAVGGSESAGYVSPRNLKVTSITDELRLATNNQSRTFALSLKDRGAVLPGGHTSNASYWMDDVKGHFMTSTFFMTQLPKWVEDFNTASHARKYLDKGWSIQNVYEKYIYQNDDISAYEGKYGDQKRTNFPYSFKQQIDSYIKKTPFGNTILFDFAKQAIINEEIGKKGNTDFLALSFSATDYIGHVFGPNSMEVEDTYQRFDEDLGRFMDFLDKEYGRDQYILFLTADHGAAHNPNYLRNKKIPAAYFFAEKELLQLNDFLKAKTGSENLCAKIMNGQVYLDRKEVGKLLEFSQQNLIDLIVEYFNNHDAVQMAFESKNITTVALPYLLKEFFLNSYHAKRSGEISLMFYPAVLDAYYNTGTSHGAWSPYDTKIPLLFYGQGIPASNVTDKVYMTDIAPTLANMLGITPPNGSIGRIILPRN